MTDDNLEHVKVYYKNTKGFYRIWTNDSNIIIIGRLWKNVVIRAEKYQT